MNFISLDFLVFVIVMYVIFYLAYKTNFQNIILLAGSYFFYGYWDYRLLLLLIFISYTSFKIGLLLARPNSAGTRKKLLTCGFALLLTPLVIFKYYDFFLVSFNDLVLTHVGNFNVQTLNFLLPVGISFYSFQAASYIKDVYQKRIEPEDNLITFLAYMSFFPQLVAGPIERAEHLLVQFRREKDFSYDLLKTGLIIALYGCILKMAIADVVAPYVNISFSNTTSNGWSYLLGSLLFGLQIYGDFYGYSLIAKGVAKMFGFDLVWNFQFPYLSTSIISFWRDWHVSLGQWLRDYVYIPLGGSRCSYPRQAANILITMLLAGLWHGASYNFLLWGLWLGTWILLWHGYNKIFTIPVNPVIGWWLTFFIVMAGWGFFRVENTQQLLDIFSSSFLPNEWFPIHAEMTRLFLTLFTSLLLLEYIQRKTNNRLFFRSLPFNSSYGLAALTTATIVLLLNRANEDFIYFQF